MPEQLEDAVSAVGVAAAGAPDAAGTATRVVTDGAADLPVEVAERLGITVVDGPVRFDGSEWQGRASEFWPAIRSSEQPPVTSPPSAARLAAAYEGAVPVVAVHVSAELSRTCDNARDAASSSGDVLVVDSRSLSVGTGLVAMAAAQGAQAGLGAARVAELALEWSDRVHVHGVLDDVDFLLRGGRGGLVQAKVTRHATRHVVAVRGHVIPIRQTRHREAAIRELLAHVADHTAQGCDRWAVGHGDATDVGRFVDRLQGLFGSPPAYVVPVGPVVGTHVGADALVVGFFAHG